jgi:CRISPR-associated exonuclease Cas4
MPEASAPTNWSDAELVPVSALQHWSYCPRQCALIHIERVWQENLFTLRGRRAHRHVDEPAAAQRGETRSERSLPLWSDRLGLVGLADLVEFHGDVPYPVEFKHGPRRQRIHDELQLAAQALCLEEMLAQPVPRGAIYHHGSRRRREVLIGPALRFRVEETVRAVRAALTRSVLPPPVHDKRCDRCSLRPACLPEVVAEPVRVGQARRSLYVLDS